MTDRPRFRPSLRPVTRRPGELQFGVAPGGVIVGGLTMPEAELVASLDGSLTRSASFERARRAGVADARWRQLLDLLGQLDVLDPGDEEDPAAPRIPGHVLVDGAGELPREFALLLRRCGVQRVSHGRVAVDVALSTPHLDRPDLVVVLGDRAIDPRRGEVWLRHRVPHLPVIATPRSTQVGPLLGPGPSSPCLWCLDLHRADRDESWPTLMAQLCRSGEAILTAPPPWDEPPASLSQLAAGIVALYAVGFLTGERPPEGVSAEVSLPWPRIDHRRWSRHPRCERHLQVRSVVA